MAIDFHSRTNRGAYASRHADDGWKAAISRIIEPSGKRVADIGCGGGIYPLAWHELGASSVTGVDFSQAMVDAACERAAGLADISFRQGDAAATGLPPASAEIVFERCLIHHLQDCYWPCFAEAHRVLTAGGTLIVQDRTPDDVSIRLADCARHSFVLPDASLTSRGILEKVLRRAGLHPAAMVTTNSIEVMKAMVRYHRQIALLALPDIHSDLVDAELIYIPFADRHVRGSSLSLIAHRHVRLSPAAAMAAYHLKDQLQRLPDK